MDYRRSELAHRLHRVRVERFGAHGAPELARRLGLPTRSWLCYESGAMMPGDILLRLIRLTDVEPRWLLDGQGPVYHNQPDPRETAPRGLITGDAPSWGESS